MRRALAFSFFLALAACDSQLPESDALFQVADDSGSIQIRLHGSDAEGRSYRLRNATFELSGTAMVTLSVSAQDADPKSLSTPLPSGSYQLFLRPGYRMTELAADGSEHPVAARLSSNGPLAVRVVARRDQQVALHFLEGEREISFGAGTQGRLAVLALPHAHAGALARAR